MHAKETVDGFWCVLNRHTAFPQPFMHGSSVGRRLVRRRLQPLSTAGLVAAYQYASIVRGAVNYDKLTPLGFQVLNGPHAALPSRTCFQPVSMALQEHTRSLADFIVQTVDASHERSRIHTEIRASVSVKIRPIRGGSTPALSA